MRIFFKWLFKIITLNGRIFTKKRAMAVAQDVKTELTVSHETNINVDALIAALGTITNISQVEATVNTVIVHLKDAQIIDRVRIKQLGAKGMFLSSNKLKIIFGDDSKIITQMIQKQLG